MAFEDLDPKAVKQAYDYGVEPEEFASQTALPVRPPGLSFDDWCDVVDQHLSEGPSGIRVGNISYQHLHGAFSSNTSPATFAANVLSRPVSYAPQSAPALPVADGPFPNSDAAVWILALFAQLICWRFVIAPMALIINAFLGFVMFFLSCRMVFCKNQHGRAFGLATLILCVLSFLVGFMTGFFGSLFARPV